MKNRLFRVYKVMRWNADAWWSVNLGGHGARSYTLNTLVSSPQPFFAFISKKRAEDYIRLLHVAEPNANFRIAYGCTHYIHETPRVVPPCWSMRGRQDFWRAFYTRRVHLDYQGLLVPIEPGSIIMFSAYFMRIL